MRFLSFTLVVFLFSFQAFAAAPTPTNDMCAGALDLDGDGPFPYLVNPIDISGATTTGDPSPGSCVLNPVYHGIWYRFVPATTARYTFSTGPDTGTTVFDTAMALYIASGNCAGLQLAACNDDEASLSAAISTNLQAGVIHYILVWSVYENPGPSEASIQLRVSRPPVPPNDLCDGVEVLSGSGPFPVLSTTNDITRATETGDPTEHSCKANVFKSVWFRFRPATDGTYLISTAEGTATTIFTTVMAIYRSTGGCSGTFTEVDCAYGGFDTRASILRNLSDANTYYIVVWDGDADSPTHGATSLQLLITKQDKPSVTTTPAFDITSTNARLSSVINPNAASTRTWFEWGTTTNYGNVSVTRILGAGGANISTNIQITGLIPGTVYHYRAVATNSLGTNYGADLTFTWNNARPNITSLQRLSNGAAQVRFNGTSGQLYKTEGSLTLSSWTDLGAARDLGNGSFEFIDATATSAQQKFYRIRAP